MALAKQPLQFFFGATNQDTSRKGVSIGDLVLAKNVQQLHPGEHIKRGGITQTAQTYDSPSTVAADSITSPDGVQELIHDSATDTMFARSTDATHNQTKGASLRLMTKWPVRFPALESGEQMAPMAKQAGDYYVWLEDEHTIRVAKRSSSGETLLATSYTTGTESIKSFAVIDNASFDANNLWIYWVDWSTRVPQQNRDWVRAASLSHDLQTWTLYTVLAGTATNLMLTSICASYTADGFVTLGTLGAYARNGGPDNYTNFINFRGVAPTATTLTVDTYFNAIKVDNTATARWNAATTRTSTVPGWTASGACALTAKTFASYHSGHCYFAFWAGHVDSVLSADLVIVDVDEAGATQTWTIAETVTNAGYTTLTEGDPLFIGSVTGHETSTGATLAASFRVYYYTGGVFQDPAAAAGCYPDRIFTCGYTWVAGGAATKAWTARGAWLAHGWFSVSDGPTEVLITGWQDTDEVEMPYHLRRLDTGAILCQFARGEAAFPGGCGSSNAQIDYHISDLQQPLPNDSLIVAGQTQALLALSSANIMLSTDIANVTVGKVNFSQPAQWRSFALAPGPIPTISSGWQTLCEAGPLTSPSGVRAYWGEGAS